MSEETIQDKIRNTFAKTISESPKFTADEIKDIVATMSSLQKPDKMAESMLKSIGGASDENT